MEDGLTEDALDALTKIAVDKFGEGTRVIFKFHGSQSAIAIEFPDGTGDAFRVEGGDERGAYTAMMNLIETRDAKPAPKHYRLKAETGIFS
jgi:hypothetical protein